MKKNLEPQIIHAYLIKRSLPYLGHIDKGIGAVVQFALIHLDLSQSAIGNAT